MPFTSTIATIDDITLRTYDYALKLESTINYAALFQLGDLRGLLTIARAFDIDTLWIVPGSCISRAAKAWYEGHKSSEIVSKSLTSDGLPRFLLVQGMHLAFPEHDDRWPWRRCTDGAVLLKSILSLQDALQHEIAWGPGWVGQAIIKELNAHHPQWLAPVELPEVIKKNEAQDMRWCRPLTDEEKRDGMWLHLFDGNGRYLAACTSVYIGEGEPIKTRMAFQARVPALWHWHGAWIWTPELEYLFAGSDIRPEYLDAYIWPKFHQALRSWGEHMWKARCILKAHCKEMGESCELAYEAVKLIYTQALGQFNFNRPDIWSMVVAGSLRSTGRQKRQMEQQGLPPCYWGRIDTLGFVSEGPGLDRYHSMFNRAGLLGGYKHVIAGPLTPEMAAAFDGDFNTCDKALSHWKKLYE